MPIFEDLIIYDEPDKCWLWMGNVGNHGYGRFGDERRSAHCIAYEKEYGLKLQGLKIRGQQACVLHKCDEKLCVNPKHLFLGTRKDNARDRDNKGRLPVREKHPMALLTWEKVRRIRERRKSKKETYEALARAFGVCFGHIGVIVRGECWQE
jgi:HNH endonuclease